MITMNSTTQFVIETKTTEQLKAYYADNLPLVIEKFGARWHLYRGTSLMQACRLELRRRSRAGDQ